MNPTYIPESELFTLIREAIKDGAYVEFNDWTEIDGPQLIEVDIVRYDGGPEGKSMLSRIVSHELEAVAVLRQWMAQRPAPASGQIPEGGDSGEA